MSTLIALYFFFNYPVLPCPCTQFQSKCHSGFIYALSATLFLISMQCSIFAFPLKFCVVKKWLDFKITYVYIHPSFSTHDILKCHNSMLHCKQKLLKDRYLLQLLINTFELFEKKKWSMSLPTQMIHSYVKMNLVISLVFLFILFWREGVSLTLNFSGFTCIDCSLFIKLM